MSDPNDVPERLIREAECERRTGLARSTRRKLEKAGEFPRRRKITQRSVGWLESELTAWISSRSLSGEAQDGLSEEIT